MTQLWATIYKERLEIANAAPDEPDNKEMLRIQRSAQHLADHFEEYPLLFFSFVQFDPTGGSIFPATWSAMLAARAEGVGSSLTSVFFFQLDEVLEILGVPKEDGWLFSSCVTFGYPTGRWGVRQAPPGTRGLVPQPVGCAARLRDTHSPLALTASARSRTCRCWCRGRCGYREGAKCSAALVGLQEFVQEPHSGLPTPTTTIDERRATPDAQRTPNSRTRGTQR